MKRLNIMLIILAAGGFVVSAARADIYSWTDENGVRYFTNYAPPKQATLLMKTPEIAYDEKADRQRRENDALEVARQELAEREAYLVEQQQEAERRIAAANARAEEALREADRILQDAEAAAQEADYDNVDGYGYYYPAYGYHYPRKIHYKDSYYYYYGGLHYKKHFDRHKVAPHKKHSDKHKATPHKGFERKFSADRHPDAFPGRFQSHRERAAMFGWRHGRF